MLVGKGRFELNSILKVWASGIGKCDLVKIELTYIARKSGAHLQFGICESGSAQEVDVLSMKANGLNYVSTSYTTGVKADFTIIPDGNLSRQIRPTSSNLMMMELVYDVHSDVTAMLIFHLNVSTVRMHYLNN